MLWISFSNGRSYSLATVQIPEGCLALVHHLKRLLPVRILLFWRVSKLLCLTSFDVGVETQIVLSLVELRWCGLHAQMPGWRPSLVLLVVALVVVVVLLLSLVDLLFCHELLLLLWFMLIPFNVRSLISQVMKPLRQHVLRTVYKLVLPRFEVFRGFNHHMLVPGPRVYLL